MTDANKPKSPKEGLVKMENKLKSSNFNTTQPTKPINYGATTSFDFDARRGTFSSDNPVKNSPITLGHYKTNSATPTLSNSNYTIDNTSPKDSMMDSMTQTGSPRVLSASPKKQVKIIVSNLLIFLLEL